MSALTIHQRSSRAAFVDGLRQTVDAFTALGADVSILEQVPEQLYYPRNVYRRALQERDTLAFIRANSITEPRHLALQAFVTSTFAPYRQRVRFVNVNRAFCTDGVCAVGLPTRSFYFDDDHLSSGGALLVADPIERGIFGESAMD